MQQRECPNQHHNATCMHTDTMEHQHIQLETTGHESDVLTTKQPCWLVLSPGRISTDTLTESLLGRQRAN